MPFDLDQLTHTPDIRDIDTVRAHCELSALLPRGEGFESLLPQPFGAAAWLSRRGFEFSCLCG